MGGGKCKGRPGQSAPRLQKPHGKGSQKNRPEHGSYLAAFLLEQWAWGLMSPQLIQTIAAKARLDFNSWMEDGKDLIATDLERISTLGSSGAYPQNCSRDLLNRLGIAENTMPEPVKFTTMCTTSKKGIFAERPMEMLLPHEMFATIFHNYKSHWHKHICPSQDDIAAWWRDVRDHPSLIGNPIKNAPGWERVCIPLSLHGDGVPIKGVGKTWSESMTIFSWCSMICGLGRTIEFNFMMGSIFGHLVGKSLGCRTMKNFWKIVCWSLKWLAAGLWPTETWDGEDIHDDKAGTFLANGFKGVLFCLRGDLEYLSKALPTGSYQLELFYM